MSILFSRFPVEELIYSQLFSAENVLQVRETSRRLLRADCEDAFPANVIRNKSRCILRRRRHLAPPNKNHNWKKTAVVCGRSRIAAPHFFPVLNSDNCIITRLKHSQSNFSSFFVSSAIKLLHISVFVVLDSALLALSVTES